MADWDEARSTCFFPGWLTEGLLSLVRKCALRGSSGFLDDSTSSQSRFSGHDKSHGGKNSADGRMRFYSSIYRRLTINSTPELPLQWQTLVQLFMNFRLRRDTASDGVSRQIWERRSANSVETRSSPFSPFKTVST